MEIVMEWTVARENRGQNTIAVFWPCDVFWCSDVFKCTQKQAPNTVTSEVRHQLIHVGEMKCSPYLWSSYQQQSSIINTPNQNC